MKTLFFISFILFLIGSNSTLTNFPGGALESYKAFIRGDCAATSTDCDLTTVSSCWDDNSAAQVLNFVYQACLEVMNASPQESGTVLKRFFEGAGESLASLNNALECEKNLPYARMIYDKLGSPEGAKGVAANGIHYASVRPEDTFIVFKRMAALAERGDFEGMGLLDGSFQSQVASLKRKEDSDWRKNAKNARQLLIKGLCESLALECPKTSSLNCMNEESSALDLQSLYEWFKSVATRPKEEGVRYGVEFLLGRGKEILSQIPQSEIECDRNSVETKLINEKIGLDTWSAEWFEAVIGSMSQFPESTWHYKVAEYRLFENNDIEAVGAVMGLAWYQVGQWHQGKLAKEMTTEDL